MYTVYQLCFLFAPSISQTLPVSVFSACFWAEWRANNCQRGNVRASGTFIPLILHSQPFTQMQPGEGRFQLYMVLSMWDRQNILWGEVFCWKHNLSKFPFITALFQLLYLKLILVLKITLTARFKLYLLKRGAKDFFFIFAYFGLNTDTRLAVWCKSQRIWGKCKIQTNPRT